MLSTKINKILYLYINTFRFKVTEMSSFLSLFSLYKKINYCFIK